VGDVNREFIRKIPRVTREYKLVETMMNAPVVAVE
jgi:hypothetical protein